MSDSNEESKNLTKTSPEYREMILTYVVPDNVDQDEWEDEKIDKVLQAFGCKCTVNTPEDEECEGVVQTISIKPVEDE